MIYAIESCAGANSYRSGQCIHVTTPAIKYLLVVAFATLYRLEYLNDVSITETLLYNQQLLIHINMRYLGTQMKKMTIALHSKKIRLHKMSVAIASPYNNHSKRNTLENAILHNDCYCSKIGKTYF